MKITKLKTDSGTFGAPVTTELSAIVERMRSEETKETAERVAKLALQSRLEMAQGLPHYHLADADKLPYLVFAATFGKKGLDHPKTFTGLLLLTISCPQGRRQVEEMKRRVQQMHYTLLAFAGVSGVTLKVVVRCQYDGTDADDYLAFLKDAQATAARLYTSMAECDLLAEELTWVSGCRMSHDPLLWFNPDAHVMPVVRMKKDPLAAYKETRTDEDGTVVWFPDSIETEHTEMAFQTCLSKAIDDCEGNAEHCLQLLADYCTKACLQEEACVVRASWNAFFKPLGIDLIRKTFRNAYKKEYKGKPVTQMNEKERIMRSIEGFLARRYELRYNTVKQLTEFRPNDLRFKQWEPMTDRQLKSIVVEEMKEGGESWMNDIRTYIESAHVREHNPIHEFLAGCGEWDGKANYIEDFARRLPTDYEHWPKYFHRWFLAMVAQALNINRDFGNSMVPMLIGGQGIKKSNFCKNILPPSMREYYMDDIKMDNAEQVERVLGRMWLVCIDEYNAKTGREQAKIKRLLTEKDVQVRKMRSDQYTMTPRLCSFIATTNDSTPLPSGDGSRRYLCVEGKGQVDLPALSPAGSILQAGKQGKIPYRQMYAQAVSELRQPDCLYWFTSEDEREIQQHNSKYQDISSLEQVLQSLFEPAKENTTDTLWQVLAIQKELRKHLKSTDVPNLQNLGRTLKKLRWPHGGKDGRKGYHLVLKE